MANLLRSLLVLVALGGCETANGRIVLRNQTERAIVAVHIDPCGAPTQGPNRLDAGVLPHGQSGSFDVELGCYQVYVVTEDQFPGYWEVEVSRGGRQVVIFANPPGA